MPHAPDTITPLDQAGCLALSEAIAESPALLMTVGQLQRGLGAAYLIGTPQQPRAAVVLPYAFPGEATALGDDVPAIWRILRDAAGWDCVNVASELAPALAAEISAATGKACRLDVEHFYVLDHDLPELTHPAVRRLTAADVPLMEAATAALEMGDWRYGSAAALIADGFAAGAVIEGELAAVGFTAARGRRYADVGIVTRPEWRNRSLSTACAALVCADILAAGETPVWGTSDDNLPSQRVAAKLGFREVSQRVYINFA